MKTNYELLILVLLSTAISTPTASKTEQPRFSDIERRAAATPTMREFHELGALSPTSGGFKDERLYQTTRFVSPEAFEQTVDRFLETMQQQLKRPSEWRGKTHHLDALLDSNNLSFTPYAQKLAFNSGSPCIFKGDLHGDAHSLIAFLKQLQKLGYTSRNDGLTIVDPDFFLVFLGDYVDRGLWGVEVMYVLMQLKIKNPYQVILVRGNHEDPLIASSYGFKREFYKKLSDLPQEQLDALYRKVAKVYECLPVVLYVGSNSPTGADFVQCCHGGMEIGFNPKKLLNAPAGVRFEVIRSLKRATACQGWDIQVKDEFGRTAPIGCFCEDFIPERPTSPSPLGFLWHDFVVDPDGLCSYSSGRGFACNKELTLKTIRDASTEKVRLGAVIRAHQHCARADDPMMKLLLSSQGCGLLWQKNKELHLSEGTVITLLLSPDSMVGIPHFGGGRFKGFSYDTSLEVTIADRLPDWKLKVINNNVYEQRVNQEKS